MEELFVSKPMSIRLKKLNFNKPCMRYMFLEDESNIITEPLIVAKNWNEDGLCTSIPMRQQVIDWLYEVKGIEPYYEHGFNPDNFYPIVNWFKKRIQHNWRHWPTHWFSSPSLAIDCAINEALNLLEKKEAEK